MRKNDIKLPRTRLPDWSRGVCVGGGGTFKEYDTTIQNLVALAVPPSRIHYLQLNKIIISSGLFHRASFSCYLLNNKK